MRKAFIIWTPLHLFNATRYIVSRDLIGQCDVFYICQSEGMETYYQGAKKENLFNQLFFTTFENVKNDWIAWKIESIIGSSKLYIKHLFGIEAIENDYSQIFLSVPSRLNDMIVQANNCREVVGLDDGTRSYISNIYDYTENNKYEIMRKVLGKRRYDINRVLLNNPGILDKNRDNRIYESILNRTLKETDVEYIRKVFYYNESISLPKIVYFNQPLTEKTTDLGKRKKTEKNIIEAITGVLGNNIDMAVRMHPRENNVDIYKGISICDNANMWEIICSENEMEDTVLIASFSTAQFTPKLLYNKEPIIVFTFKLYNDYPESYIQMISSLAEELKYFYSDKTKVFIPENMEDLCKVIDSKGIRCNFDN